MKKQPGLVEKAMFGGIGFLLNGNMCCGIWKESLILRIGPDAYEGALKRPHVREFDITGRPMRGWIMLDGPGFQQNHELIEWVNAAVQFAGALPAKGSESVVDRPSAREDSAGTEARSTRKGKR
jgi:hypothetical protein